MDILENKKTFFNHVFSTSEDSKSELLNVVQYSVMGVVPIVILNKLIQKFIPEADTDKSSLELLVEIFFQLTIMFCGIVIIHRIITYFPTYSGIKYENFTLTNVILAFLVIVLSIQTKLGIKVNILFDRLSELWNGEKKEETKPKKTVSFHSPSQADFLDDKPVTYPPAPIATKNYDNSPSTACLLYTSPSPRD